MKDLSGRTCIVGIFGDPVEHSLSPAMHNAAFDALGLDWCYVPFHVLPDGLPEAVRSIRALGLRGVNITVPHKEAVLSLVDTLSPAAEAIGAVNTIVNEDGRLAGHNTDGFGFIRSLEARGISLPGTNACVLGAGGAARAVCHSLLEAGLDSLSIVNRTLAKGEALARDLTSRHPGAVIRAESGLSSLSGFRLVVNTTLLGLHASDPLPLDPALLHPDLDICDLIYTSGGTPLLRVAAERGCRVTDGAGMLLWQGWQAFRLWTGQEPPVHAMAEALRKSGLTP